MKRLWQHIRPGAWRWGCGIVMLLLTNAAAMAVPELFRRAVNGLKAQAPPEQLRQIALYMVLTALAGAMFRTASRVLILYAARDVELSFRSSLFRALTALDAPFFRSHPPGDLMSRATNDLTQVRLMLGPALLNAVNTIVAYGTALPLMMRIDARLTIVAFLVYPPTLLWLRKLGRLMYQRNRAQQEALGRLSNAVQENLSAVGLVRAYAVESEQIRRFRQHNDTLLQSNLSLAWVGSSIYRVAASVAGLGTLAIVALGAADCMSGRLNLGDVVALVEYMALLSGPTFAFGWVLSLWQRGTASLSRLEEILSATPAIADGPNRLPRKPTHVSVRRLSVEMGGGRGLHDVSFELAPGQSLGIVGAIGSGKSTLAKALLRLVPYQSGALRFDDKRADELAKESIYRLFGYVPQEPSLLSKSIVDNVAFGKPDAKESEVLAALEAAGLLSEARRFDDGIHTIIGERGVTLSGGQKQRCAIARALLSDAPILLFDDALSAVDTETEARILDSLRSKKSDSRSLVLIAHRIATVSACDEILLLDEGRIAERGSHAQLMAKQGAYAEMAQKQRLLAQAKEPEAETAPSS